MSRTAERNNSPDMEITPWAQVENHSLLHPQIQVKITMQRRNHIQT